MKRFHNNFSSISPILIVCTFPCLVALGQVPVINSLDRNGQLSWTFGYDNRTNNIARLEISTNLIVWTPFYYDFVSTNLSLPAWRLPVSYDPPTNLLRTAAIPTNAGSAAFFRVGVQRNIPDTNLVLHLTFNNDFSRGIVLD